jgi:hypothetical protein
MTDQFVSSSQFVAVRQRGQWLGVRQFVSSSIGRARTRTTQTQPDDRKKPVSSSTRKENPA